VKKHTIKIDVYESKSEIVRLRPSAMNVVRQLQRETGLSASCIVSQIIEKVVDECGIELNFIPIKEGEDV
jgi:hypothetical protein